MKEKLKLANPEENNDDGDARYKAKITQEQQEISDALNEFEEKFEQIKRKNNKTKDAKAEDVHNKGSAHNPEKERSVDVSRNKNIQQIVTDTFSISVFRGKWKKIIDQLKNIFGILTPEEKLLQSLGANSQLIKQLIKNGGKYISAEQMRISAILLELSGGTNLSKAQIKELIVLQQRVITQLQLTTRSGQLSASALSAALQPQKVMQIYADQQKIATIGKEILGVAPSIGLAAQKSVTNNEQRLTIFGTALQTASTLSFSTKENDQLRMQAAYAMQHPYNTNIQHGVNLFGLITPIEVLVKFAAHEVNEIVKFAGKEIQAEFSKIFGSNKDMSRYDCNTGSQSHYEQRSSYSVHHSSIHYSRNNPSSNLNQPINIRELDHGRNH